MKSKFRSLELSDPRFTPEGLRFITVGSPALNGRGDLLLALPKRLPKKPLARILLLHGMYGSSWNWALKAGVHKIARRMASSGSVPDFALIMPSDGLWGNGSAYRKHHGIDFEKWVMKDALGAAAELFPKWKLSGPLFLCGLSMGGYAALNLGARHSKTVRAISAHSPSTSITTLNGGVGPKVPGPAGLLDRELLKAKKLPPLRFDCGTEDFHITVCRQLHATLEKKGVKHAYDELEGGHDWPYWERNFPRSLKFFAEHI